MNVECLFCWGVSILRETTNTEQVRKIIDLGSAEKVALSSSALNDRRSKKDRRYNWKPKCCCSVIDVKRRGLRSVGDVYVNIMEPRNPNGNL